MPALFIQGCICMGFLVASLFFFRFWKSSRDSLLLLFGLAFLLLSIERVVLALGSPGSEVHPGAFTIRLAAFALIIAGIIQKNRR
jgi:hypothetical protein